MLLPIKLVCDQRARKDGTHPIGIQYCYSSEKRTILATEIHIPIRYWNKKHTRVSKELPAVFGDADMLNEKLGILKRTVEDIISFARKRNVENVLSFLKKNFHPNFDASSLDKKDRQLNF